MCKDSHTRWGRFWDQVKHLYNKFWESTFFHILAVVFLLVIIVMIFFCKTIDQWWQNQYTNKLPPPVQRYSHFIVASVGLIAGAFGILFRRVLLQGFSKRIKRLEMGMSQLNSNVETLHEVIEKSGKVGQYLLESAEKAHPFVQQDIHEKHKDFVETLELATKSKIRMKIWEDVFGRGVHENDVEQVSRSSLLDTIMFEMLEDGADIYVLDHFGGSEGIPEDTLSDRFKRIRYYSSKLYELGNVHNLNYGVLSSDNSFPAGLNSSEKIFLAKRVKENQTNVKYNLIRALSNSVKPFLDNQTVIQFKGYKKGTKEDFCGLFSFSPPLYTGPDIFSKAWCQIGDQGQDMIDMDRDANFQSIFTKELHLSELMTTDVDSLHREFFEEVMDEWLQVSDRNIFSVDTRLLDNGLWEWRGGLFYLVVLDVNEQMAKRLRESDADAKFIRVFVISRHNQEAYLIPYIIVDQVSCGIEIIAVYESQIKGILPERLYDFNYVQDVAYFGIPEYYRLWDDNDHRYIRHCCRRREGGGEVCNMTSSESADGRNDGDDLPSGEICTVKPEDHKAEFDRLRQYVDDIKEAAVAAAKERLCTLYSDSTYKSRVELVGNELKANQGAPVHFRLD